MRYLSAPWVGLLASGAWLDNARHANAMARQLAAGLSAVPGVKIVAPVQSNAVFVEFPENVAGALREIGWIFYDFIGVGRSRLMCSWATTPAEVQCLVADVERFAAQSVES
jgi:threonine aldolase